MGNPVLHFEVLGKDPKVLQSFYRDAFDWEMAASAPGYAMALPKAQGGINGGIGAAMGGGPGHVTFYIEAPDLKDSLEKIAHLGGRTVMGPMAIPGGPTIALFGDPEGHVVGLVQAGTTKSSRP
ncbi:MAG: hypothetical protein KGJ56_06505 [Gammaproteobacteria bacterium]|nr:hypothetical protein [Gammaproteobacteria bacterium]